MKYIAILYISVITLFISSCNRNSEQIGDVLFPQITLGNYLNTETTLSEIFNNPKVIHLDTTSECLIGGRSNKVIKKDNYIYIKSLEEILIFDQTGKFQCKLSKLGTGPGEYEEILDFDIVPQYDEIWVNSLSGILRYKIPSLEYCGKISLDFYANKIKYIGNEKFIALTPNDKVFNLCSIEGLVLESFLDKDLANSGEKTVQFVNIDNFIVSQLFNSNSAVCFNEKRGTFKIKDIISPDNDNIITTEINKQYYNQYGYFNFDIEVMKKYIGIIGFRKIKNQTIMSLRYPESKLALTIDNGNDVKEYVVSPSDDSPIVDDIFNSQDLSFLMSFAACESDDSFLFVVPNDDTEMNPSLLEVSEFK